MLKSLLTPISSGLVEFPRYNISTQQTEYISVSELAAIFPFNFPGELLSFLQPKPTSYWDAKAPQHGAGPVLSYFHPLHLPLSPSLSVIPTTYLRSFAIASFRETHLQLQINADSILRYTLPSFFLSGAVDHSAMFVNTLQRYRWMKSLCASNSHVPIALFQHPFVQMTIRFAPSSQIWDLHSTANDAKVLLKEQKRSSLLCNRAWTVKDLRQSILTRLTNEKFREWDLIVASQKLVDKNFVVVHVDWSNVTKIQQIDLGYGEMLDSSTWYGGSRSFILVACPHRDQSFRNFCHINAFADAAFPQNEAPLHPA